MMESPNKEKISPPPARRVDIEQLLQWAFRDELPKRQISSAEGIWDRMAQYGSLGGVNPDTSSFCGGGAQRYAQFGLPHQDAETIEQAVAALGRVVVDWDADFDLIAHELAALVDVNGVHERLNRRVADVATPARVKVARGTDGLGIAVRVDRKAAGAPRDVIAVGSVNLAALVHMHAVKSTRPNWHSEALQCRPVPAARGKGFALIGECLGRNLYAAGSHCPLHWSPSPIETILARADYLLWHRTLMQLAQTLKLDAHQAELPQAPAVPWRGSEIPHRTFKQKPDPKTFSLREIERPRAGPPLRRSKKRNDSKGAKSRLTGGKNLT